MYGFPKIQINLVQLNTVDNNTENPYIYRDKFDRVLLFCELYFHFYKQKLWK